MGMVRRLFFVCPTIRPDPSDRPTQCGLLDLPVLRPFLLPCGHDAALRRLPQHPAAWDLYLSGKTFVEEEREVLPCVRYWDRQQWNARLFQVASKRTTMLMESPGQDRRSHIAFREMLNIRCGQ